MKRKRDSILALILLNISMYLKPPLVVQYPDSRFEVQALLLHKRGRRRVDVLEGAKRDPLHVQRLGGRERGQGTTL